MAEYPLMPLLAARKFREDEATRYANQARIRVEQAKEKASEARNRHLEYQRWRPGEEAKRFEPLKGQYISQSALEGHRKDIQALRDGELRLAEEVIISDNAVVEAEQEVERAHQVCLAFIRARRKIEEHKERWFRLEAVRAEAAEEAELEDFPCHGMIDSEYEINEV